MPYVKDNPPTRSQVVEWWALKGCVVDRKVLQQADLFIEWYEDRGWKDARGKLLKVWRAAATGWAIRGNFTLTAKAQFAMDDIAEKYNGKR